MSYSINKKKNELISTKIGTTATEMTDLIKYSLRMLLWLDYVNRYSCDTISQEVYCWLLNKAQVFPQLIIVFTPYVWVAYSNSVI